jgi:hypothetical protein
LGVGSWELLAAAVLFFAAAAAITGLVPLLFGSPQPMVHVQWGSIADAERRALEQRWRLTEAAPLDDNVWTYVPADTSTDTLRALVMHPSVIDTDGINRRVFAIADAPPLTPRRGGLLEGAPVWMSRAARLLALVIAGAAGVLLIVAAFTAVLVDRRGRFAPFDYRSGRPEQSRTAEPALRTIGSVGRVPPCVRRPGSAQRTRRTIIRPS